MWTTTNKNKKIKTYQNGNTNEDEYPSNMTL